MAQTHWKSLTNAAYLGAYSLEQGKDAILKISYVRKENVVGSDGKREDCIVCHFENAQKPMILNVTNCKTIAKVTGTNYIEGWAGKTIQVGIEKVKAFGDIVEALRVRKIMPKGELSSISATSVEVEEEDSSVSAYCECCGVEVSDTEKMKAHEIVKYSLQNFRKVYCAECMKKIITEKKESEVKNEQQK